MRYLSIKAIPHVVLAGLTGSLVYVAERHGALYRRLLQEDGWAEWASFLAFAVAGGLALVNGIRGMSRSRWERVALLGLGVFCLFVAGEEISWGQRLVGYRPPDVFLEHNYQQEANLHNLLKNILDTRWMVLAIAVIYGLLSPLLARIPRYPKPLAAPVSLMPWFAVVAWLEYDYPYHLTGEFAELLLGMIFLFDVIQRVEQAPQPGTDSPAGVPGTALRAERMTSVLYGVVLVGAVGIVPLNDALLRWHGRDAAEEARHTLQALAELAKQDGALNEQLFRKRRVHKRVYTALQAGYLNWDTERFYLDPWHQPYWIVFERTEDRRGGYLLLYSFGPNRRRDSLVRKLHRKDFELEGDDSGVLVEVQALGAVPAQPSPARTAPDRNLRR